MSFNLERVPAVLHTCEMHGKRAKKSAADNTSTREKLVTLTLDVTDDRFSRMVDECWPGADLLVKSMAGASAPAQDIVSRRKMGEVRIRVLAVDGKTEVFSIPVARCKGNPTLRIAPSGEKVRMNLKVVGPIASDRLGTIDGYTEADVYVDVGLVQTDVNDVIGDNTIDGEIIEGESKPKRKPPRRAAANKTAIDVDGSHLENLRLLPEGDDEDDDEAAA